MGEARISRAAKLAKWQGQYASAFGPERIPRCVYCGGRATGEDHVPPVSFVDKVGVKGPLWVYPACGLCNCMAASYPADCLVHRAEFIICQLRREFVLLVNGVKRRTDLSTVRSTGRKARYRLDTGRIAAACRCGRVTCNGVAEGQSKTPDPEDRGSRAGEAQIGPSVRHGQKIAP